MILSAQIHPRAYIYLQPDFATAVGASGNVAQLRDWYADIGLDAGNEFRVRIGQSKVPFSYENMQSSQNRLPLDRADATNSAAANGTRSSAYLMWAPSAARQRYRSLVSEGLKGSGGYGESVAVGIYNGQTANRPEANDNSHVVGRVSYPFVVGGQILEPGVAAYTGRYVVTAEQRSTGVKGTSDWNYRDERVLATLAIAPKPIGVLAEYDVGRGPEFNPVTDSIETRALRGGFVTVTYRWRGRTQQVLPFVRYQGLRGRQEAGT
ncbi:MAG: porin [Gemmatimonadaceae bacterium]|nr:porin [Gemmatimonadaceae bacterium]